MLNPSLAFLNRLLNVQAQNADTRRRGRLLGILIWATLTLNALLMAINLRELVGPPASEDVAWVRFEVLADVIFILFLASTLYLNRSGHTRLAGAIFLIGLVAGCTLMFGTTVLDRVLLLYATPILASSFILSPGSSFIFALLSALGYTLSYRSLPIQSYNYLSMLGLALMATVAWLAARSVEKALGEVNQSLARERAAQEEWRAEIAERKQAEEKLYEAEARYRTLVERIPAITYIAALDEASTTLYISPQIETILGFSPADYRADPDIWREQLHADDRERVLAEVARSHATGEPLTFDYRMLTWDGRVVWFHDEAVLVRDADGRPLCLQGVMLDITERKRMEAALQESEERHRTISELVSDYAYSIRMESDGRMVREWTTGSFTRITGFATEERDARGGILCNVHPDDMLIAQQYCQSLFSGNWEKKAIEFRIVTKSGEERWVRAYARPKWDEAQGHVMGFIGALQDITERKQAEMKLQEAEARFRTLVEQIPAITYIAALDETSTTLYVSPQIEAILGFSPADYQANRDVWRERLHPDDRERVLAKVAYCHATGEPLTCDYRMLTRDGRIVCFRDEAVLVRDADGRPLCLQGIMFDITERKRMEAALRESEARYRSLVETSPDGIALVDLDARILFCNRQDAVLHGYESIEEMIGKNALDLVAPEDRPRSIDHMRQLFETGSARNIEVTLLRKDGTRFAVESSGSIITNMDDQPQFLVAVVHDITERKRVQEALQESELRYRTLFEGAPMGIGLATLEGQILAQNDAMCQITGYSGAQLRQVNLRDIYQSPEERALLLKRLQADGFVHDFEVGLKREDGTPYWASLTIARLTLGSEDVLLTMVQDITRRKQAEEALQQSEQRFRAMVEKGQETISIIGRDGIMLYESPSAEHVLGYKSEELVGKHVLDLVHPGEICAMRELYAAVLDQPGLARSGECVLKHKDGSWRTMEFTVTNFLSDPAINGIIVNSRDITERKRAEEALRQSEETARGLLNATTDAALLIDATGTILALNETTAKRIGKSANELLGACAYDFSAPEIAKVRKAQVDEAIRSRQPIRFEYEREGGWLDDYVYPIVDAQGRVARIAIYSRDITEQRQMEELLMRHTQEMEALYNTSLEINSQLDVSVLLQAIVQRAAGLVGIEMGGLYLIKPDGQTLELVVSYNLPGDYLGVTLHLGEGLAGCVAQTGKPMAIEDYIHWEERAAAYANAPFRRVLGVPLRVRDTVIGVIDVVDDKKTGPFGEDEIRLVSLFADQAAIAIENARLFNQVQVGRDRLQALSRRLVEVQEAERRHLARELHDEVGQVLTGLKLLLEMSARQPGDAARDNLSEAQALTHDLLTRVREMSLDLRPAMLDDLGLLPTLLWHLERYTTQTNVCVTFQHALPEQRFAPELETVAYRVVQEALTNIARHAGVCEATVRLWTTQDTLGVQVEDQGTGFDPEARLANSRTGGLSGMRERVALVGGQLTIDSAPGAGTRLTAELPLNELEES